jgi:hypothetical protein
MTGRPVIVGAVDSAVGRLPEHNCMSLHALVARQAVADAHLEWSDIDEVLAAFSITQPHLMLASVVCEYDWHKAQLHQRLAELPLAPQ